MTHGLHGYDRAVRDRPESRLQRRERDDDGHDGAIAIRDEDSLIQPVMLPLVMQDL